MKLTLVVFFSLMFSFSYGQFPQEWEGHYSGTLKSKSVTGASQEYHMELIVSSINDSTWTWTIIYGEDSLRQERRYFLKHEGDNKFDIDEDNSIVLSNNRFNNQFVNVFEVQGNLIHVIYTFEKNKVIFDLTSSSGKYETGNTENEEELNNEGIPIVYGYETGAVQHAELKRIKKKK